MTIKTGLLKKIGIVKEKHSVFSFETMEEEIFNSFKNISDRTYLPNVSKDFPYVAHLWLRCFADGYSYYNKRGFLCASDKIYIRETFRTHEDASQFIKSNERKIFDSAIGQNLDFSL